MDLIRAMRKRGLRPFGVNKRAMGKRGLTTMKVIRQWKNKKIHSVSKHKYYVSDLYEKHIDMVDLAGEGDKKLS